MELLLVYPEGNTRMPARFNTNNTSHKSEKDPDACLIGALGCSLGGHARASVLHPKHLSAIGKHGAKVRWNARS